MIKRLLLVVVLVMIALPTIKSTAMENSESMVEVQLENGGWLVCPVGWAGFEGFPYGMYDPPLMDSPEFQFPCNRTYTAIVVIIDDVRVFEGPGTIQINPYTLGVH